MPTLNAKIEKWTRTPPDGLKRKWEGALLSPVSNHQVRALDLVDPGGGDCQIDGLASLHPRQVAQVLDYEEHIVSIR
ncbi:unnamed protein product [Caretta caretta]